MPRHRRRTGKVRAALSLGLLIGVGATGTYASWSDTSVLSSGSITSGSLDLQFDIDGGVGSGTNYARTQFTWSGLAPGERKAFNLEVRNVGNPPFAFAATATRGTTPDWTFVGTPISVEVFGGTAVADSTYPQQDSCTGPSLGNAQLVDGSDKPVIGPPVELAPGASRPICIVIGLDVDATNENQAKTGSVALTFTAEQVT